MHIGIVGSRDFKDLDKIREYVRQLHDGDVVVSGGARGVDRTAAYSAHRAGLEVIEIKADWDRYGKSAGMIRNRQIIACIDRCVVFWDGESKGSKMMIEECRRAGIPVEIIMEEQEAPGLWG